VGNFDPSLLIPVIFALGLIPVFVVLATSYTKLVVVFALLKNALGLQQVPPATVTNALALVLTVFIMYPVGDEVMDAIAAKKGDIRQVDVFTAIEAGKEPIREFLDRHVHEKEREFFFRTAQQHAKPAKAASITKKDLIVLLPAFTISELTEAFLIGFLIFLPFIVVDLVVANVLMALGMQMLSPTMISLPLKVMLFVLLDGWSFLSRALVSSYL
jgi:type III secretion protein R